MLDVLWPAGLPKSADAALRVHLSRLRRLVRDAGAQIERRPDGYELVGAVTDLDRFDALMGQARLDRDGARDLEALATASASVDEALRLWRGDPFAPFSEREDLADLVHHVQARREDAEDLAADLLLDRGLHHVALVVLEGAAAARPFHEQCWARLMLALYRCGRQRDALAAYERARTVLVEALGVEPGPELQRLHHDILAQSPLLDWSEPGRSTAAAAPRAQAVGDRDASMVAAPRSRTTLVGRDDESIRLRASADRLADGESEIVLVRGESGIGKTALVERFVDEQTAAGRRTVVGRCERNQVVPLHAFLTALAPFIGEGGGPTGLELERMLGPAGASQIRRVEELEVQRHRLLTLMGQLVADLTMAEPLILVIDDAHWADPLTLAFVEHLAVHHSRAPVLLVLGVRSASRATPVEELVADLTRERHVELIDLAGLSSPAIAELLGRDGEDATVCVIHRAAGGNPLYALQLQLLMADGETPQPLPDGLHALCRTRLAGLSPGALELLEVAAVLGVEVSAAEVASVLDEPRVALSARLVEVAEAGIIEGADGFDRFRFVHGVIHQAVYEQIEPVRRAHLHAASAGVLERDADQRAAEIAMHLVAAQPLVSDGAVATAALRAGNAALRLGDHGVAERSFRIVVGLEAPGTIHLAAARLGLGLGLAAGGDLVESDEALAQGIEEARAIGRWDLVADSVIARGRFGLAPTIPHALRDAERIDDVLRHLPQGEKARRAYLLWWKSELLMNISTSATEEALRHAEGLVEELDDDALRRLIQLARLRQAEANCDDPGGCCATADAIVRHALDTKDRAMATRAALARQAARLRAGDLAAARADQPTLLDGLARPVAPAVELNWQLAGVGLALATDSMEAADEASRTATEVSAPGIGTLASTARFIHLLQIRREQRRLHELEPMLVAALAGYPRRIMRPLLATSRAEVGDEAGARAQLDVFLDELELVTVDWTYLATLCFAAEEAATQGHTALAEPLEERLLAHPPQVVVACSVLLVLGHVDRYLGLLAMLRGDLDTAVDRLAGAADLDRRSGSPLWAAWAAHGEAAARLRRRRRGDATRARTLLDQAATIAGTHGSPRLAQAVDGTRAAPR
jgi:DNA-binding SARP family transcriptional activator